MNIVSRSPKKWPYAQNSAQDSVGKCLGALHTSLRGDILYWEAKGEARKLFESDIKKSVLDYLREHSDKAQESGSHLSIPLFMVGRQAKKSKPVVMFVSDDKVARKEAYELIVKSDIMAKYPGFELGHSDCEKLVPWAGEGISIHSSQNEDTSGIYRLRSRSSTDIRMATAGGSVSYGGKHMLLTVSHFLKGLPSIDSPAHKAEASQISDCEITGLSDFDDGDDDDTDTEFVERTRQGSVSDVEDSKESEIDDSYTPVSTLDSYGSSQRRSPISLSENIPSIGEIIGEGNLVFCEAGLDYALLEVDSASSTSIFKNAISLEDPDKIESGPRKTAVRVMTSDGVAIHGDLSENTLTVRLPHSKKFVEVYTARFFGSLGPGDCGCWVRDAVTDRLFGHVFAGNLSNGLTAIMPAKLVFEHAQASLGEQFALAVPLESGQRRHELEAPILHKSDDLVSAPSTHASVPSDFSSTPSAFSSTPSALSSIYMYPKVESPQRSLPDKGPGPFYFYDSIPTDRVLLDSEPNRYVPIDPNLVSNSRADIIIPFSHLQPQYWNQPTPSETSPFLFEALYPTSFDSILEVSDSFDLVSALSTHASVPSDFGSTPSALSSTPSDFSPNPHDFSPNPHDFSPNPHDFSPNPHEFSEIPECISLTSPSLVSSDLSSIPSNVSSIPSVASDSSYGASFCTSVASSFISSHSQSIPVARMKIDEESPSTAPIIRPRQAITSHSSGHYSNLRRKVSRVFCTVCNDYPDGFRGPHELNRHMRRHDDKKMLKRFICRDPACVGIQSDVQVIHPLSKCESCSAQKQYLTSNQAIAHIWITHIKDLSTEKAHTGESGRPLTKKLKDWCCEVQIDKNGRILPEAGGTSTADTGGGSWDMDCDDDEDMVMNSDIPESSGSTQGKAISPPVNPADQNPPCNTLYVGNLPIDTSEEELKALFSLMQGYKRLCFRIKQNGPMCFVEFEDVGHATKALTQLYGWRLHNSVKGGIRLSFSKNSLGVRSLPSQSPQGNTSPLNGMLPSTANAIVVSQGQTSKHSMLAASLSRRTRDTTISSSINVSSMGTSDYKADQSSYGPANAPSSIIRSST